MRNVFLILFCSAALLACKKPDEKPAEPAPEAKAPQQSEFADPKYVDMGKKALAEFSAGDIDAWMLHFADNAVYSWSAGDSLAGKQAIADYWKTRRAKVIDSISFKNDIWLPIKVNTPQRGPDTPGVWLLSWHQVNAKYKNGKKLSFWVHTDFHFDASDKIDRVVQYIDRAPINAAVAAKK